MHVGIDQARREKRTPQIEPMRGVDRACIVEQDGGDPAGNNPETSGNNLPRCNIDDAGVVDREIARGIPPGGGKERGIGSRDACAWRSILWHGVHDHTTRKVRSWFSRSSSPVPTDSDQAHDCIDRADRDAAHFMTCMEVWGGNRAVDSAVSTPGLDVWVFSRPWANNDHGGDIHYLSMCAAGNISRFALADVAGHGDVVADLAGSLRTLMRKNINTVDQSRFTRSLNEAMTDQASGRFATAILATFFAPSRHLILTNAGHPRPLWFRQGAGDGDGQWALLDEHAPGALRGREDTATDMPANLPLGIIEPTSYSQFAVQMAPGDLVLLYSDAMIEAATGERSQLGEDGLAALAGSIDRTAPEQLISALLGRVLDGNAGSPLEDDVTMILLHANGAPPRAIPLAERISAVARLLGFRS